MIDVIYHFTSKHHLPMILKDGFLKLTESQLRQPTQEEIQKIKQGVVSSLDKDAGELYKPVVWLTNNGSPSNMGLDGSAFDKKEIRLTLIMREHYQLWTAWSKKNRANEKWSEGLKHGKDSDSWYISERIIPLTGDEVIRIENIVTGEVFIDVETGKGSYQCAVEPARGKFPVNEYYEYIGKSGLKRGDIVNFEI